MAKPQIITLPCVLLLWDYWPLQRMFPEWKSVSSGTAVETSFPGRTFGSLVLEKLPLFLLAGVSAHLTQAAQQAGGWHSVKWTRAIQIGNAIVCYVLYLAKAFWPSHMALFYPHPGSSLRMQQVAWSALLLLAITCVVLKYASAYRYVAVGWFWFLGMMVPMSGVLANGDLAMADRYAYQPYIGLFLMVCWTVAEWTSRHRISVRALAAVAAVVVNFIGRGCPHSTELLAGQRDTMDARARSYARQLHCGNQPRLGPDGRKAFRRSAPTLPRRTSYQPT